MQTRSVESLISETTRHNLPAAAELTARMEPSPTKNAAVRAFADESRNEPGWWPRLESPPDSRAASPQALAWLQQLDPESRMGVLQSIAYSWSSYAPRDFASYLGENVREHDPAALSLYQRAATALAKEDPAAALEWIARQVPTASRRDTETLTFGEWAESQPETALAWLHQLPQDDARRGRLYELAVSRVLPLSAFQTEGDGSEQPPAQQRQEFMRELTTDPTAAQQTLRKLNLSDPERTRAAALLRLGNAE